MFFFVYLSKGKAHSDTKILILPSRAVKSESRSACIFLTFLQFSTLIKQFFLLFPFIFQQQDCIRPFLFELMDFVGRVFAMLQLNQKL